MEGAEACWLAHSVNSCPTGLGFSPEQGHCVVFLNKTLYPHSAPFHLQYSEINAG